jgi:hypothetical protein
LRKKSAVAVAVCVVGLSGLSAGTAFAGEITGNGKWIAGNPDAPLHGQSECAFSGQNDEFQLGDTSAPRTQSWGQNVREAGPLGGVPGVACNPSRADG